LIVGVFAGTLSDEREYDLLYVVMRDGTKVGYFGTDWAKSFKFVDSWASDDSPWGWVSTDGLRSGSSNGFYRGEGAFVSASFDMAIPRLSGLITAGQYKTKTVAFGGGAIAGSSYRLDEPASIRAIEGRWELVDSAGNVLAFDIAADGGLTGSYRGCIVSGSTKASDGGENVIVLSFDFGQIEPNCLPNGGNIWGFTGFTGFAIALPMVSGAMRLAVYVRSDSGLESIAIAAVGQR
jgi:hypothetical protein